MTRTVPAAAVTALLALVLVPVASAQTVDELVARNLASKGGLEQIRAIGSIRQTSEITTQGMVATMTVYAKRPNLMRQEMLMGGQTVVNGFDGQTPWMINRMATGSDEAVPVTGAQADMVRNQASFDGPLVDYRERGMQVELVGLEDLDGRPVHHLKLTNPQGEVQHIYLDGDTALESRIVSEGAAGRLEQVLSDYRQVNGMTLPFRIAMYTGAVLVGDMKVLTVEFNPELDDALFRMVRR